MSLVPSRLTMVLACLSALSQSQLANADQLMLRDEAGAINGQTVDVTSGGIIFRSEDPINRGQRLVTLDRVRDMAIDNPEIAAKWEAQRDFAEKIWRARSRVERGDFALAEPVLVNLFRDSIGRTDATSLIIAEGLLRCRLARGAHTLAVLPWLETRRLMQAGQPRGAYFELDLVMDPVTGLCVDLPPVWVRSLALDKLIEDLDNYHPVDAPGVRALAALYAQAARLAIGMANSEGPDVTLSDIDALNDPGAALAWAMVTAQDPAAGRRVDVDRILARHLRETGLFTPWAYFARGTIRARVLDQQEQAEGLVDLLTVPALFAKAAPTLSGFALGRCADVLEGLGRTDDALMLRRELEQKFSGHPLNQVAPRTALHTTKD